MDTPITNAITTLKKAGYYTGYLFHVDDVKRLTDKHLTDEEARSVLENYYDFFLSEINHRLSELIDDHIEDREDENN